MTNDTTQLDGALAELGENLANNLISMGVTDADAEDGLTTLAEKILDVNPSVSGLNLTTNITLSHDSNSIYVNINTDFIVALTVSYDDTNLTNVDLSGVLTGANVLIKEGNTTIGTGVTNANGIATVSGSLTTSGEHELIAVFEGTENFNSCSSNTIEIEIPNSISTTLTYSSAPTSGYVNEDAIITATLKDINNNAISGATVYLWTGSSSVGKTTDSSGNVSFTITQTGTGSMTYYAKFNGDSFYNASTGATKTITFSKRSTTLTYSSAPTSGHPTENVTIQATLKDNEGSVISGQTVYLYVNGSSKTSGTTNANGVVSLSYTRSTAGTDSYYVKFNATTSLQGSTSSTTSITWAKGTPTASISKVSKYIRIKHTPDDGFKFYYNNTLITTSSSPLSLLSTNSVYIKGATSGTTYSIKVERSGDSAYNAYSQTLTITF